MGLESALWEGFFLSDRQYPNEAIRLMHERGSVRNFEERPVPDEVLEKILEAGVHSATGGNLQPYSIIRFEKAETKQRVAELCGGQSFIAQAPVNLLFCIDLCRLDRWAALEVAPFTATQAFRNFWVSFQDTVICAQSICTAADAMGLGSCYVASILECFPEMIGMFSLPKGVFPVVLVSLGYPKTAPKVARKLGMNVVVHREKYQDLPDHELLEAYSAKYPGYRLEPTAERLAEIGKVCEEAHDKDFAELCLKRIDQQGFISMVQRYYGLHYCANEMPLGNERYVSLLEKQGFVPFRTFEPAERK